MELSENILQNLGNDLMADSVFHTPGVSPTRPGSFPTVPPVLVAAATFPLCVSSGVSIGIGGFTDGAQQNVGPRLRDNEFAQPSLCPSFEM